MTTQHRFEIFRAGTHTAMNGTEVTFTPADLQAIAKVYDPALHEAPITVGHPTGSAPSYGWVKALQAEGEVLYAQCDQMDPAFIDLVKAGRFKKRSAAFYTPDSPNNPKPGSYYPQHVAWLGAQAPAVKGLKDVAFADGAQVLVFGDWTTSTMARLSRSLRDWLISKFGQDEADKALPSWDVQALADEAVREAMEPDSPDSTTQAALAYSEGAPSMPSPAAATAEDLAAREAKLAADIRQLNADREALAQREGAVTHKARLAEFGEFLDTLIQPGTAKLLPRHRDGLMHVMASMPDATVIEFGEGDAKTEKPAIEVLKAFLSELPQLVQYGEIVRDDSKTAAKVDVANGVAVGQAAIAFMESERAAGREITVETAVQHVINSNSEG